VIVHCSSLGGLRPYRVVVGIELIRRVTGFSISLDTPVSLTGVADWARD